MTQVKNWIQSSQAGDQLNSDTYPYLHLVFSALT